MNERPTHSGWVAYAVIAALISGGCVPAESETTSTPRRPSTTTPAPEPNTRTPAPTDTMILPTQSPLPMVTETSVPTVLAGRAFPAFVFDPQSEKVVLFGGLKAWYSPLSDTWVWDPISHQWSATAPSEAPQGLGVAVYDDKESRIIVYVGSKFDEAIASDIGQIRPVGETWAYDVEADTWEDMQAVDTPVGLLASSIAFDSESGQVILYGGADLTREKNGIVPLSDATWSYNLADNVWTQMSPKDPPPARALAAMTYDVGVDRVVLFGGHKAAFTKPFAGELAGGVSLADTWEYDFNDDAWSPMEPAMAPEARRCGSMVYDSFLGRSILVGGSDGLDCSGSFRDSWAFDAMTSTWTRLGEAPQLTFQGMAYIPETNEIVAYVGGTAWIYFKPAFWAYNLDENEWREVEAGK